MKKVEIKEVVLFRTLSCGHVISDHITSSTITHDLRGRFITCPVCTVASELLDKGIDFTEDFLDRDHQGG